MFIQVPNAFGGVTWVFDPDFVPPSIAEVEHAREAAERADQAKQTKESVDYGPGMAESHCSICRFWMPPDGCQHVEGEIKAGDWCKLFSRDMARHDATTAAPEVLDPLDGMHELDIARAIAEKRLASPQEYENIWLFAMRITGTGASFRPELNEHVWRDPGLYLNSDFLDRCNGLPVIWEHPPGNELDQSEFEKRIIGAIMLPYIERDEVWGIGRIYDQYAAKMMCEQKLSTSPAVVFSDPGVNQTRKLEGGRTLLIEGEPSLVDHLAVCELGVWDKGGLPTGIAAGVPEMADGPAGEGPDARLDRIGSVLEALRSIVARF